MWRVGRALVWHELIERARDRWVLVVSILFALLASAVTLYGRTSGAGPAHLTGPSLVTLASLLVPLVALVLGHDAVVGERERNTLDLLLSLPVGKLEIVLAKFVGRALALCGAIALGLGGAVALAPPGHAAVLAQLMLPSLLLGAAFLAIGVLISAACLRQITAASTVVAVWFLLVFFYDLGLLALLVVTDGAVAHGTVTRLVVANPGGLFRLQMMEQMAGAASFDQLGISMQLPGALGASALWAAWIAVPVLFSAALLSIRRTSR